MSDCLKNWQRAYSQAFLDQLPHNWSRRAFLRQSLKTAVGVAALPLTGSLLACSDSAGEPNLALDPWHTIAAVQERLFPRDAGSPGANDIHAVNYLFNTIHAPDFDAEERQFLLEGVTHLNALCQEHKQQPFISLTPDVQESMLRQTSESSVGDRWLGGLLTYILEALLADPVYGGNPNGIGWQWLEHTPGFPRPAQPYFQK